MATSQFRQLLDAATAPAPGTDTLPGAGCRCGLSTSWCMLHGMTPKHDASFRNGRQMRCCINIREGRPRRQGCAAPACIFTSYPRVA
ncbi:hypothetical protein [Arthrobacter sp. NPDC093139]|uniref:hypothetical protein n=1 Tax=Arthrobacter sp. NPDC093139 TaxID=3363945 RepID=UPI003800025B